MGNVGLGFTQLELARVARLLEPLATPSCPFEPVPEGWRWLRPELVCKVRHYMRTKAGILRAPAYAGMLEGADPAGSTWAEEPIPSQGHLIQAATLCNGRFGAVGKARFRPFFQMIRTQQRLNYSDTFIGNFLQSAKMRKRNSKGPVEAPWSSGTFRNLFPGAQWLRDGTTISLRWWDMLFVFNLEAIQDSATNAIVGFIVSDTENETALRLTYEASLQTTGGQPPCL